MTHPTPSAASFGGGIGNAKSVKCNAVVPVDACDGQLDAAEGGASPFGLGSPLQGERLGRKSLRSTTIENEPTTDFCSTDPSLSTTKSVIADTSVSYGRQQNRLTAQLAAKQIRRPSQVLESLPMEEAAAAAAEGNVGPWGLMKKDLQIAPWNVRLKLRLQKLSHALLVRPSNPRLQTWFYVCVLMALLSGWEVPFHFAFVEPGGLLKPYYDWVAIVEYVSSAVFFSDFLLKFNIVYIDPDSGALVGSHRKIAWRYLNSWQFYMDFIGWFPLDWITIDTAAARGASTRTLVWLAWIKMLTLVRMYRVFELFAGLDYRMVLGQGALMLTRNYTYVFYITHWAACVLYHIAAHQTFSAASWVGRNADRFMGRPVYEKYLLSLYFSVSAFTGLGDGALFASTVPEAAFMILYLLFNLFLGAYILGTVTMLVVKGDERSKAFRERMSHLNDFSKTNELPERLQTAMQDHLEVTFNTEQIDDEHVLSIYPTTIRRKVLRHLYLQPVRNCYLFKGCKQRFLDALLTAARVELFMPGVQLMVEGDNVTELNIIVSGDVLVAEAGINLSAAFSQFASTDTSNRSARRWSTGGGDGSVVRGSFPGVRRSASVLGGLGSILGRTSSTGQNSIGRNSSCNGSIKDFLIDGANGFMEMATGKKVMTRVSGDALAEVSFFTDVPSNETIMSQSVVRVLSIPKVAWEELMGQFPQQARLVLTNLQQRTENALSHELQEATYVTQLTEEALREALQHGKGRKHKAMFKQGASPPVDLAEILPPNTIDFLHRLDDARAIVRAHVRKVDQLRTFEFLGSASDGDIEVLRTMLNQGMNPNSADYDGRTGLMLAASGGHEAVVRLLLDSGAKSDQLDAFGNSAMCEAVKNAHDSVIDVLLGYGATLAMDPMAVASSMCTAVYEGDLIKLRRLLRSGAPPDACDYDKRSALHIAGAEGNLAAVKLLIEEGGADPNFQDRWGNTALDEARRVGATPVVAYLESLLGANQLVGSGVRYRQQVAADFLSACGTGDVGRVRHITHNSHPGCIFTGLILAASKGFKDVAELLLAWVPSDILAWEGHMAMVGAARMGHSAVVAALRSNGVKLPDPRDAVLFCHMRSAVLNVDVRAVAALLAAGVDVRGPESTALLHLAVSTGSLELVRRLVEEGGMRPSAEDSGGKSAAAVADAAKLASIADYLRWATATVGAASDVAASGLVAAAAVRFGPLRDLSQRDTHEDLTHGVTAPETFTETDEDEPPILLARMASASSAGSSRRLTALGSMSRQVSARRSNVLWKLSSMARMAANSQPDEGDSSQLDSISASGGVHSMTAGHTRRARRASLTNFLTGHRVDGITVNPDVEVDLAAILGMPSFSGPSMTQKAGKKQSSSTGYGVSVSSNASGAAAGAVAHRRSSASSHGISTLVMGSTDGAELTGLTGLTGLSTEVAGLREAAGKVLVPAAVKQGSFLVGVRPVSRQPGLPPLSASMRYRREGMAELRGAPAGLPAPESSAVVTAVPARAASSRPPSAAAAGGGGSGPGAASFAPSMPLEGGTAEGGAQGLSPSLSILETPPDDALEHFLKVAPSAFSASKMVLVPPPLPLPLPLPPPPPQQNPGYSAAGGGGGGGDAVISPDKAALPEGQVADNDAPNRRGALANGDWSHRTLEKRLTALGPPGH
ncbi:hypothetical protein VaNZ11_004203 [Volvox africanus]|uniref:Cyclic nucleotide-binding domain-containing protein n=1 Tax=Volvox africanus TaxID=51714 RepID=A0ABQ5RWF5_9CHLO|nr:hypothetical protein VaNZ11_004203 [Volvox africanus]